MALAEGGDQAPSVQAAERGGGKRATSSRPSRVPSEGRSGSAKTGVGAGRQRKMTGGGAGVGPAGVESTRG